MSRRRAPLSARARDLLRRAVVISRAGRRPEPSELVERASDWRTLAVLLERGYVAQASTGSTLRVTGRGYRLGEGR